MLSLRFNCENIENRYRLSYTILYQNPNLLRMKYTRFNSLLYSIKINDNSFRLIFDDTCNSIELYNINNITRQCINSNSIFFGYYDSQIKVLDVLKNIVYLLYDWKHNGYFLENNNYNAYDKGIDIKQMEEFLKSSINYDKLCDDLYTKKGVIINI